MPILFEQDDLPDGTYGICQVHAPDRGIVRLVDENGVPAVNGICIHCWEEMNGGEFFGCPVHGVQRKIAGQNSCPVPGCLGEGAGPTEDEIERLAESYNDLWPGGPPKQQNALDEKVPEPPGGRDREVGESARDESGGLPGQDGRGVEDDAAGRDPVLTEAARTAFAESTKDVKWRDPFLEP